MIYLLVQDSMDYDDCDRPIFAHHDKEVVEKIHMQLMKRHQELQTVAKRWQEDVKKIQDTMPYPPEPNLEELPLKPLIWTGHRWENSYLLEYQKKWSEHNRLIEVENERLRKEYAEYYLVSMNEINTLFSRLYERSYSIEEVEDDPNVDVGSL